jgi:uncharacterized protein (TIGR03083 family)
MQGPIADEFAAAARWLAELTALVGTDDWGRPALGSWDVRSLVGHAARAMVTVEDYLACPAEQIDTPTALAYILAAVRADPAPIAARGVDAGAALGDKPASRVAELAVRVTELVAATAPDALMTTSAGGMTLDAYLPTRTVELVVHGCDLAAALRVRADPPSEAASSVVHLLAGVHLVTNGASAVCLALAGRPTGSAGLVIWPS